MMISEKFIALLDFFINETQTGRRITIDNYAEVVLGAKKLDDLFVLFDFSDGVSLTPYAALLTRPTQMNRFIHTMSDVQSMLAQECREVDHGNGGCRGYRP
jgi:hypothetical protein